MPSNHFAAIVRWREQLDALGPGLESFDQAATVSTMLFGCQTWLEHHAATASVPDVGRIQRIKTELELWLTKHYARGSAPR